MSKADTRPLRILVVDDSAYNRRNIGDILASAPDIELVGKAGDGEEALRLATTVRPDVITLDLEMPKMDGFTFLRILMSRQPTPVIVVSSYSQKENVFKALELGAVDFVAKPDRQVSPDAKELREQILSKIQMIRNLRSSALRTGRARCHFAGELHQRDVAPTPPPPATSLGDAAQRRRHRIVDGRAHGAHRHLRQDAHPLSQCAARRAAHAGQVHPHLRRAARPQGGDARHRSARHGHGIRRNGRHLSRSAVHGDRDHLGVHRVPRAHQRRRRPAIATFRAPIGCFGSAATALGNRAIGVILTGMGDDGVEGARAIRAAGGIIIAESQETAVVYGMPGAAVRGGSRDRDAAPARDRRLPRQAALSRRPSRRNTRADAGGRVGERVGSLTLAESRESNVSCGR